MNISNDGTGIPDFVGYFTTQFLIDLGRMAELRDELVKRQGAISAVEDAIKAKADAEDYAINKKASADDILAAAKTTKATAEALVTDLKNARQENTEGVENGDHHETDRDGWRCMDGPVAPEGDIEFVKLDRHYRHNES